MDRAFLSAARSLLRLLVDPRRYRTAMASITVPVLLVHGDQDRLVPVAAARDIARRHPAWRYLELAGVGHVPAAAGARAAGHRGPRLAGRHREAPRGPLSSGVVAQGVAEGLQPAVARPPAQLFAGAAWCP